ncbi:hypothetical protein NLG97_g11399 [Lecanicillium saksenae]|uniref:Uncharacterized protein n=1 Tax=Lecanicillium saksenae TaxID=468837 RepID=A0ACC1QEC2_9HYPO|nr:hypothetical protein NLG97_g11399 [Lecanicillium saksenae]
MTLPPPATSSPRPLRGLKVVIIHVKENLSDGPAPGDVILKQLEEHEEEAQLGCEFIVSKSVQFTYGRINNVLVVVESILTHPESRALDKDRGARLAARLGLAIPFSLTVSQE